MRSAGFRGLQAKWRKPRTAIGPRWSATSSTSSSTARTCPRCGTGAGLRDHRLVYSRHGVKSTRRGDAAGGDLACRGAGRARRNRARNRRQPQGGTYRATLEELEGIDRGLKAAREARFATDEEVETVIAKPRR